MLAICDFVEIYHFCLQRKEYKQLYTELNERKKTEPNLIVRRGKIVSMDNSRTVTVNENYMSADDGDS